MGPFLFYEYENFATKALRHKGITKMKYFDFLVRLVPDSYRD